MNDSELRIEVATEYSPELAAELGRLKPDLKLPDDDPIPEDWLREIIGSADREQLLAYMGGRLVGAMTLNVTMSITGRSVEFFDFVVAGKDQGSGVGDALWARMLGWCRERNVPAVTWTCKPMFKKAHPFYRAHGAQERETIPYILPLD